MLRLLLFLVKQPERKETKMGIKSWFKEHKKLVTRVGFGVLIGGAFGVACRLIFKEDDVDPIVFSQETFDKAVNAFEDKAMDATFDALKDKIVDADKYENLDSYLKAFDISILAPGGSVNPSTGEVVFD